MPTPKAKIICTLGPSSSSLEVIREMVQAGMNVARLNMSHGDYEHHGQTIEHVREASRQLDLTVGIMMDLQGPKIRVRRFAGGAAELVTGTRFTLTPRNIEGNHEIASAQYANLATDLKPGDRVLLDDGLIALQVLEFDGEDVVCEVLTGGILRDNKGINVPDVALSVAAVTDKDREDADFGVSHDVDYIALSFVRSPEDVAIMRRFLQSRGADIPIIAKIEKPQAVDAIDDIIDVTDGIMVARGDLGVEMPTEAVPAIQKSIIAKCNRAGRPVITATQMLESMMHNPRPTRAEASDVANAILDGTDAVMLSGESATGDYPVGTVETMRRIIVATEKGHGTKRMPRIRREQDDFLEIQQGVAASACLLAEQVDAAAIASITMTGSMAASISKYRPATQIFAISNSEHAIRRLTMVWGIRGISVDEITTDMDSAVEVVRKRLVAAQHLKPGDMLVLTAGVPFADRNATNMVRVDVIE